MIWINSKIVNHKVQSTDLYVSIWIVKYTCILLNLLCKKIKIKRVYQHTIKTELSRPFLALKLNVQIFFKIVGLTRDLPPFSKILLYYCLSINWMHSVYSQIRPFLLTLLKKVENNTLWFGSLDMPSRRIAFWFLVSNVINYCLSYHSLIGNKISLQDT